VQDSHHDDNQTLASHTKKGKRNRRSFGQAFKDKKTSAVSRHVHRKDISRIQCFRCDKYGHIARNCPSRKKGRQHASTADVDLEPHQRDEDIKDEAFFFISTLSGTVPTDSDIWLIDSDASTHMTVEILCNCKEYTYPLLRIGQILNVICKLRSQPPGK
jgi:hypothetical protein